MTIGDRANTHLWSGAWAELLPCDGKRVLLVESVASRARFRIAQRAAAVGVLDHAQTAGLDEETEAGRIVRASLDEHLADTWDLVVVDGPTRAHSPAALGEAVTPEGHLVYALGNRLSPISRDPRALRSTWPRLARDLRAAGWTPHRRFGLFRSAAVATTAFDIDAAEATQAVLAAALVHLTGRRAVGVQVLRRAPAVARTHLVPAWLVVTSRVGQSTNSAADQTRAATAPDGSDLPVTGRMGYESTPDSKLLLGEPPKAMERTYAGDGGDDAEAMALDEMARTAPGLAPPLLARPRPGTLRIGWLEAKRLDVRSMPFEDLVRWTMIAARLLRQLQAATARPDGSVLVHGDYWLGNLLVDAGGREWLIDWGGARWGPTDDDRSFLEGSLDGFRELTEDERAQLRQAVEAVFAGFDDLGPHP